MPQLLGNPAGPLLEFAGLLGIQPQTLEARENLLELTYYDEQVGRDVAAALTIGHLRPLVEAYGDALRCRFSIGQMVVLDVGTETDEATLRAFREETLGSPTLRFTLGLDKQKLLGSLLGTIPDTCAFFLYLFPSVLEKYLTNNLAIIESDLWGRDYTRKVVVLVPSRPIWIDGSFLAVIGGDGLDDWQAVVPTERPNGTRVARMYDTCRSILKWQERWLRHLTPLHLMVEGRAGEDDLIQSALKIHLANLAVLYTADRTARQDDGRLKATFVGANQSVDVVLENPGAMLSDNLRFGADTLAGVTEWAYSSNWAAESLSMIQITMVQALQATEPASRYNSLLANAPVVVADLRWCWKAFTEGKLDSFMAQVRALENYVSDTVDAFGAQIASMIKNLSDAMLAAVAALLASFFAALFKDKVNEAIFSTGMYAYAGYVMVFCLGYNMLSQRTRYLALVRDFEARCQRFGRQLLPEKVADIVGTRIEERRKSLKCWYGATCVAYGLVLVLALGAATNSTEVFARLNISPSSQPAIPLAPTIVPAGPVSPSQGPGPTTTP